MDRKIIGIKEVYQGTQETREYEFKSGFVWRHPTGASLELVKTMISMLNTPTGGVIILGIEQQRNNSKIEYKGLLPEQIESFEKNEELIKRILNGYASISISPNFLLIEDSSEKKTFLTISVPNYKEYPCLIKKDGIFNDKKGSEVFEFRMGDLFSRSKNPPFSTCKVTQDELNEMIELCAKGVRTKSMDILNIKDSDLPNQKEQIKNKFEEERRKIYGDIQN